MGGPADSQLVSESPDGLPPLEVTRPRSSRQWALEESAFGEGLVGGKSGNLARLRGQMPDWIHVPASVALPFGSCERVLQDPVNAQVAKAAAAAQQELVSGLLRVQVEYLDCNLPPYAATLCLESVHLAEMCSSITEA